MFRRLPKPSFLVFKHMNGTTGAATAFIPGDDEHSAFLECEAITSFSKRSDQSLDDRAVRNQEGITGKRAGALDLLTNELLQLRIGKSIATLAAQDVIAVFRDEEDRVVLALRADTERSFHHGSGIALRSHRFRRNCTCVR